MKKRFESSIGWFGRRVEGIMSWRFLVIIQVDSLCSVISNVFKTEPVIEPKKLPVHGSPVGPAVEPLSNR